jgi:hypothetical protein
MEKTKHAKGGKELEIFGNFYSSLANKPATEVEEMLRKLIPPHKLFMLMEGTKMTLHFGGLRIFDISSMLSEAGIPDNDPRTEVYKSIKGGFAPKDVVNALRGIAAKEEKVCRSAGAIPLNAGEQKRTWWVPIANTSAFKAEIDQLIADYHKIRDDQLILPYSQIRTDKEKAWMDAAQASFDNLTALGKQNGDKQAYLRAAQVLFDSKFPSPRSIVTKVVAYSEALQEELPAEVEIAFQDLRKEEAERMRMENEALDKQTRIQEVEVRMREAEAKKMEDEQEARSRMLRESMARDVNQAREIVMKLQVKLTEVALEIVRAIEEKKPISGSLKRSWTARLEQLNALSPENPSWQKALGDLKKVMEQTGSTDEPPSEEELINAEQQVDRTIEYMRQRAGLAVVTDSLYALVKAGKGEAALQGIRVVKDKLNRGIEEVGAIEELLQNREDD